MEEEPSKLSQLFCPVKGKPMQFAIVLQNVLNVECERVLQHIEDKGGEFMGFDPENNDYIALASHKYQPLPDQIVFDIKYVKRCVKEKKLLDLRDFQLGGESARRCLPFKKTPEDEISGHRCFPFQTIVEEDRCRHFQTAEEVLKKMKSLKVSKETPKGPYYCRQEILLPNEVKLSGSRKIDVAVAHQVIKKRFAILWQAKN